MKLLLFILLNFISYVYSYGNLYGVTKNFKNSNIDLVVVDSFGGSVLSNYSITLPYNLQVQGIENVNFTTNVITLFCTRQANGEDYSSLVWIDVKSGEIIDVSNFIAKPINQVLNNGIGVQNYLYGYNSHHTNQVYLPTTISNSNGLNIVNWNFQSTYQLVNVLSVSGTSDIDDTINPQGTLEFNGNLIVLYHSKSNPSNIGNILILNLNGTTDSSGSGSSETTQLIPVESYQIELGYDSSAQSTNMIYSDSIGSVYIVSNDTQVCKIDFIAKTCNYTYDVYNSNESQSFPSFIQSQDKQTMGTITSPQKPKFLQSLTIGLWDLNFSAGVSSIVSNYYTKPSTYTYLAI